MFGEADLIDVIVARRRSLAQDIDEFTLEPVGGHALPPFAPGAHVSVETPSLAMRRYSLTGFDAAPGAYVIAVKREASSRGGSASMHGQAVEGTRLRVHPPECSFPLGGGRRYLLIAGGIGVTPIIPMGLELLQKGADFELIYCTRSAGESAYLPEMRTAFGDRLIVHHDEADPARFYDFWDHFETVSDTDVYCCGPKPLMEEVRAVSGHWPAERVYFEDFKPVEIVRPDDRPFEVELARSGKTVAVPADRSILEAVRDTGVRTVSSCESGTCGSCRCGLIAGDVDHRDMVLSVEDKRQFIMICVSRARSGGLVLDL